jgi:hypothetical protein
MTALLLDARALRVRRDAVAGSSDGDLARLADSLAADLATLIERGFEVPREKARLTRRGGRCEVDGALLEFDPWSPHRHRCPTCGREYEGAAHDRWWIMGYQLWLAERSVHAATLHALRGESRHATLARDILAAYADAYVKWPNQDNVLGPTRPFFSTYLESIWLLQLCVALDLLESTARDDRTSGELRSRLIAPSAALIASYDEGMSNRQVWNDAALLAAGRLLGDSTLVERALVGPSGLVAHLSRSLLSDGTWYEGENYHLFAHRGLWYGVVMAARAGFPIGAALERRFDEGFVTPFLTALPDLTFPSRRDSQYAVSLRQWRFAELAELGLARRDDERLVGALERLYDPSVSRGDSGRARSTAEAERNIAPSGLARSDLGWRSLLFARPALPSLDGEPLAPSSVLLDAQGYGVLRRDAGRIYVALDYGHSGAGHGHPDRLGLVLCDGGVRWLDDPGTGSYVDPSLHWYRSTLAHDAPLVDARSQRRVHGRLVAWEDRGGAGWIEASVDGIAEGVTCRRTIVAMPDYVIDLLAWQSARGEVTLDLPLHVDGEIDGATWTPDTLVGGDGVEDGFAFLRDVERASRRGAARVRAVAPPPRTGIDHPSTAHGSADAWVEPGDDAEWWRAVAPGPPGSAPRRFHLVRARGARGRIGIVWALRGSVVETSIEQDDLVIVRHRDGTLHEHRRTADGWHVDLFVEGARSSIDLARLAPPAPTPEPAERSPAHIELDVVRVPRVPLRLDAPSLDGDAPSFALGEWHWRGAEDAWSDAGSPRARVAAARVGDELVLDVEVAKREPHFAPRRDENPLDNEHPDTNSDGVQIHLALPAPEGDAPRAYSWLLVPEPDGDAVRISPRLVAAPALPLRACWRATEEGYAIRVMLPIGAHGIRARETVLLDVIVNEMPAWRERRRGQLVLSGTAPGERAYLLGDRHAVDRFAHFVIDD